MIEIISTFIPLFWGGEQRLLLQILHSEKKEEKTKNPGRKYIKKIRHNTIIPLFWGGEQRPVN
jgi:hypothetical protein